MVIRDDPGHRGVSSGISMFDTYQHLNLIFWFCQKKPGLWPQYQVSSRFRTKVTFSLIVVVLCLLQPLHPVVGLQINVRFLKVVSKDSSYLKCCIDTKIKSPARSEPNLQFYSMRSYWAFYNPSTQLLNWGSWKWSQMIPYNQKIWDLTPKSSLQHAQTLIYNFTPWSCPWLPTAPHNLFLTIRLISASCKWSQMIPRAQKPGVRHQNQLSSMATISLGSAEWRFWERVGKLQMGQILIKMSQFFVRNSSHHI